MATVFPIGSRGAPVLEASRLTRGSESSSYLGTAAVGSSAQGRSKRSSLSSRAYTSIKASTRVAMKAVAETLGLTAYMYQTTFYTLILVVFAGGLQIVVALFFMETIKTLRSEKTARGETHYTWLKKAPDLRYEEERVLNVHIFHGTLSTTLYLIPTGILCLGGLYGWKNAKYMRKPAFFLILPSVVAISAWGAFMKKANDHNQKEENANDQRIVGTALGQYVFLLSTMFALLTYSVWMSKIYEDRWLLRFQLAMSLIGQVSCEVVLELHDHVFTP